jgi:hypothetical protein
MIALVPTRRRRGLFGNFAGLGDTVARKGTGEAQIGDGLAKVRVEGSNPFAAPKNSLKFKAFRAWSGDEPGL